MKKFLPLLVVFFITAMVFGATFVDDLGRFVTVEENPARIVIAAPAVTGFIEYLGETERIVGVTDWDHLAHKSNIEKIGNVVPLNLEKIMSLEPDIVFLTGGFQEPEVAKLERAGLKAFAVNPTSFEEIHRSIAMIGAVLGVPEKGRAAADQFKSAVLDIAKETFSIPMDKKPTVLYTMISGDIKDIWTCGTGSFLNQAIAYAGGLNVAAPYTGNDGWLPVGPEFVVMTNPDIILVPYYYEGGQEEAVKIIRNYRPFSSISAVKNDRVIAIDGNLVAHASPSFLDIVVKLNELFFKEDVK